MLRVPGLPGLLGLLGVLEIVGLLRRKWAKELDYRLIKELWAFKLNAAANGGSVSYQGADGRQYVAVVATGVTSTRTGSGISSLASFAMSSG